VDPKADLIISLDRETFNAIVSDEADFEKAVDQDKVKLKGDIQTYHEFWGYFDENVFADRIVVR